MLLLRVFWWQLSIESIIVFWVKFVTFFLSAHLLYSLRIQTKKITMPCGEHRLIEHLYCNKWDRKDSSSSNNHTQWSMTLYSRGSVNTRNRTTWPEIAWKGDVCRLYLSTFNNAALPELRPPPEVGCCVSFLLLTTQLKPFPKRGNNVWIRKRCQHRQSLKTYPKWLQCLETKAYQVTKHHKALR